MPSGWENAPEYGSQWGLRHWLASIALGGVALAGVFACNPAPRAISAPVRDAGPAAQEMVLSRVTAYDGDTLRSGDITYRLAMVDTPELDPRAKCTAEHAAGIVARDRVRGLLSASQSVAARPDLNNPGQRSLDAEGWPLDAFNRRLAYVTIDGDDLGQRLLSEKLAVVWSPTVSHDWCAA